MIFPHFSSQSISLNGNLVFDTIELFLRCTINDLETACQSCLSLCECLQLCHTASYGTETQAQAQAETEALALALAVGAPQTRDHFAL